MNNTRGIRLLAALARRLAVGLAITSINASAAAGQSTSGGTSDSAKATDCKGNFLTRAVCKGATRISQAAISTGMVAPPKLGTIPPPDLPVTGTYRIWLVQPNVDSLAFFVRTITPMDFRVQEGEWAAYTGRFVSAMSAEDLPASLEGQEVPSQSKIGGGPWMILTSATNSTRFAIQIPIMLPTMHPSVLQAKKTWVQDAMESAPPIRGWQRKEFATAANAIPSTSEQPTTFEISWTHKKRTYSLRGVRINELVLSPRER